MHIYLIGLPDFSWYFINLSFDSHSTYVYSIDEIVCVVGIDLWVHDLLHYI